MAFKKTDFHSATKACHHNVCNTCDYLLIGKQHLYPRVRSAPGLRLQSSSVEHAPRHHSEESTNYPETTLRSRIEPPPTFIPLPPASLPSLPQPVLLSSLPAILSTQSDPWSPSPVGGPPTLTNGFLQSTVPSSEIPSPILTPSDVALASGRLQTDIPTVTPIRTAGTHVGIIIGIVLGGLVAILLGVAVCYCLFKKTRKGRRRKIRYNNLQSEDEGPYLLSPEADDSWVRYPQIDDLSAHNEQYPKEFGGWGGYISLPQRSSRGVHYSYPLADLTPSYRGHNTTFSSAGGEESQSILVQDRNSRDVRRSDIEGRMPRQHDVESDSRANGLAERRKAEIISVDAHASSRASILSWARTAFGLTETDVPVGYHRTSSSSRTTVVDMDQISLPRRLQKWQRPLQPKRGAG